MSWQATSWVIQHSQHKGSALLTLLCIANCSNESGTDCWPTRSRLAKDTRMSERQLDRVITKLEASGELAVRRSEGRYAHHYAFPLMANVDKMSRLATQTKSTPNVDISRHNVDIATSTDPSIEQSEEKNTPLPPKGERAPRKPSPSARVASVFQHWREVLFHPQAKLDPKRLRAIQARLRDYTVEDLKRAIEGCKASPFHMGQNDTGHVHDDISLICRDATHVEMFMERLTQKPPPPKDPSLEMMKAMGIEWKPRIISTPEDYWSPQCPKTLEEVRATWN